jgi:hypothetical protein
MAPQRLLPHATTAHAHAIADAGNVDEFINLDKGICCVG